MGEVLLHTQTVHQTLWNVYRAFQTPEIQKCVNLNKTSNKGEAKADNRYRVKKDNFVKKYIMREILNNCTNPVVRTEYIRKVRTQCIRKVRIECIMYIRMYHGISFMTCVTSGSFTGRVLSPNKLFITPAYIVFLTKSCRSPSPEI